MKDIRQLLKERILIFDGAMGTSIHNVCKQNPELKVECNEFLNISHPHIISQIHEQFLIAGADIIETNTFGALDYLLKEFNLSDKCVEINRAGVNIALDIAKKYSNQAKPRFVSGSMGPGTKLLSIKKRDKEQITFDEMYQNYYTQAKIFISEGVHLIQIETGQDPLQMKCALKAVLDIKDEYKSDIPVFLQATIQENGQMLVGMDTLTFIHTFSDMPIDGLGINCGTGPQNMESFLKIFSENCPHLITLLPNAGLPVLKDGQLSYNLSPEQFAETIFALNKKYRINAVGGCCGTTHEYIKALADKFQNIKAKENTVIKQAYLSSLFSGQEIKVKPAPLIIGERANVNGSKKFKTLLHEENWEAMNEICLNQQDEGAHVIDICLMQLDRNEERDIENLLNIVNQQLTAPLMIDTTSFNTVKKALENISGKPIVNSVNFENGEEEVIRYIKLCRDMNAALVCLAIDEDGMAKTQTHKLKILERFINHANRYNFSENMIFFDCLTFALSTGDDEYRNAGKEAVSTIRFIKDNFPQINTVMGVSNVSFGLKPKVRKLLNSVFLHECVKNGLTAAIVDSAKILPVSDIPGDIYNYCIDLIYNNSNSEYDPLLKLAESDVEINKEESQVFLSPQEALRQAVIKGRINLLNETVNALMQTDDKLSNQEKALSLINQILLPAMQEVGILFENGKIQLPFVLKSAEVMKKTVDLLKPYMSDNKDSVKESMLLATVQGDVHDIGKNLVQIILENNSYQVFDIGVKQSPQNILNAIKIHKPDCLGMSALLIKSTAYMKETLEFLTKHNIQIPVICGGAALNEDFVVNELQSVYKGKVVFGKDAFSGLRFMQSLDSGLLQNINTKLTQENKKVSSVIKDEEIDLSKVKIPVLPFNGNHPVKKYPLKNFKEYLNHKFLFYKLWQFSPKDIAENAELKESLDKTLELMWSWAEEYIDASYVYGYYYANSKKDSVVVYSAECGDCSACKGCTPIVNKKDIEKVIFTGEMSGIAINKSIKDIESNEKDIVAFQLVTLGEKAVQKALELKNNSEYQNYFYWHGFCSALTEALAAKVHATVRFELNLETSEMQKPENDFSHKYKGARLSFGYSALPDIFEQNKVLDLLKADEIGVSMTDSGMLEPEFSTCAMIMHYLKNFEENV